VYVCREFSYKSRGERILKIGPHLPKLLSNKGYTFFWTLFLGHSVVITDKGVCRPRSGIDVRTHALINDH